MPTNWISRQASLLFTSGETFPAEFVDRDAERVGRELAATRIRFPHHA